MRGAPAAANTRSEAALTSSPSSPLTYRAAGVDIEAGDALVDAIKPLARATDRPGTRPLAPPWELSANRAISVREILAGSGVPDDRFASVTGKADTEPLFPDNPYLPANRRVTVTLLSETAPTPRMKNFP